MSLTRIDKLDTIIPYGSIQFNATIIIQRTGKFSNLLKENYNGNIIYINGSNSKVVIFYNNNQYHYRRFIRPQNKPIEYHYRKKYKSNHLIHFNTDLNAYTNLCNEYVLRDKGRSNLISHLEVWECSSKNCNASIILDGLKKDIYNHNNNKHNHENKITNQMIELQMRNSVLETHIILNKNKKLKTIYDEFNSNYFNIIKKENLATHYEGALKKRIYRSKKDHETKTSYNIDNIIKNQQIKNKNKSQNTIDKVEYNPYEYFDENKYAIPYSEKRQIVEILKQNKHDRQWLLEKSIEFKNNKLKATELDNLINDFIKSLNIEDNDYKKIRTKDFNENQVDILIIYSKAGFKMVHKNNCKILGCDATFGISPQKELWKEINKSYAQVSLKKNF